MIIRLSDKKDIPGIVALWNEAFGDSEKEILFFINEKYIPENTLIIEENGEIASMLFLLEGKMCINGIDYPSYYLYAACTLKKYRGRGFMAKLLEEAREIAASRKVDFICLMPGEKSLFGFYEKFGYRTVFSKKVLTTDVHTDVESVDLISECADNYDSIRNKALSSFDYFKWDRQSVKFAFAHNKMYSGKQYCRCNGYCLYSTDDDVLSVKEITFTDPDLLSVLNQIAVFEKCRQIKINLPSEFPTEIGEYEIIPSAMMLGVNEHSKSLCGGLKNAYLGLTLD